MIRNATAAATRKPYRCSGALSSSTRTSRWRTRGSALPTRTSARRKLAIEHRTRAYELRDRVSERERYYITSHYYGGVARDLDKALETYDLWKQTYPNDPIPYINAGLLYSQRGDEERALQGYLKAIELDPMRRFAYGNAIARLIDAGRVEEAKTLLAQQVKYLGESDETRLRLYELAGREGDRNAAAKYAAALDRPGPQQASFLQLRSAELAYYGRIRESHKAATRAVELLRQQGQAQRANLVVSNQAILAATLEQNSEAQELRRLPEGRARRSRPPDQSGVRLWRAGRNGKGPPAL